MLQKHISKHSWTETKSCLSRHKNAILFSIRTEKKNAQRKSISQAENTQILSRTHHKQNTRQKPYFLHVRWLNWSCRVVRLLSLRQPTPKTHTMDQPTPKTHTMDQSRSRRNGAQTTLRAIPSANTAAALFLHHSFSAT